jgi:regulator of replication initiation timing
MAKDGLLSGLGLPLRTSSDSRNGRRTPLATLLAASGLVTTDQIEDANAEGARTGETLAEVVVRHGWASEEDVARVIAQQYELPFLTGEEFAVEPEVASLIDPKKARHIEACPVGYMDQSLVVAIADPAEARLREVRQVLGDKSMFVIVTPTTLRELYDAVWEPPSEPDPASTEKAKEKPKEKPKLEPLPELDLDTGEILEALGAIEAAFNAGVEVVESVRGQVQALVEATAAQRRELVETRARLDADDESRRADLEQIASLEEQLEQKTQFVNDLKAKLGDVFSGLEAAG